MEFHEKLQELRKRKGLTQEELAEELELEQIQVDGAGNVTVWLGGDCLWGRSIRVTGTVSGGPGEAALEE